MVRAGILPAWTTAGLRPAAGWKPALPGKARDTWLDGNDGGRSRSASGECSGTASPPSGVGSSEEDKNHAVDDIEDVRPGRRRYNGCRAEPSPVSSAMRALRRAAAALPGFSRRSHLSQPRVRSSELTPSGSRRPPRGGAASRSSFRAFPGLRSGSARGLTGACLLLLFSTLVAPPAYAGHGTNAPHIKIYKTSAGTNPLIPTSLDEDTTMTYNIKQEDSLPKFDVFVNLKVLDAQGNESTLVKVSPTRVRIAGPDRGAYSQLNAVTPTGDTIANACSRCENQAHSREQRPYIHQ